MAKLKAKTFPKKSEQPFFVKHKHLRWLVPLLLILVLILMICHKRMNTNESAYYHSPSIQNNLDKTSSRTTPDSADGSVFFKSPVVNNLGYTLSYPYNWTPTKTIGRTSTPSELSYEFKTNDDLGNIVTIVHHMTDTPTAEINQIIEVAKENKLLVSKETNRNNIDITKVIGDGVNNIELSAYIISPQGFYSISNADDSSSHRGIAFDYFLSNFNIVKK